MNYWMVLLGLMLFALANNAEGSCTMFDFSNGPDTSQYDVLNAYDSSGLFKGYLICSNNETGAFYETASKSSTGGYSVSKREGSMSITLYVDSTDPNVSDPYFSHWDSDRNREVGQIDIDGYNASYCIKEEKVGTEKVDRETRNPLGQPSNIDEAEDLLNKQISGNYREVNIYKWFAELYVPIDSKTVLRTTISVSGPEDAINEFKQIHITRITGENPRYLINEGNRLFEQGLYEDSLLT